MKQKQLQELVQLITRSVLKEYSMLSTSSSSDKTKVGDSMDQSDSPEPMTASEKFKADLQAKKDRLQKVRTADMDLKSTKTQSDYFNQQIKQNKLKVIAQQKELQNLKAGKSVSSGGAGSISVK